jgi:hypothetical protein
MFVGKPKSNPVELLFVYLGKYVASKAPIYNNGSWWCCTKENFKKILMEMKDSVRMVQSWYCRTFTEMNQIWNPHFLAVKTAQRLPKL